MAMCRFAGCCCVLQRYSKVQPGNGDVVSGKARVKFSLVRQRNRLVLFRSVP